MYLSSCNANDAKPRASCIANSLKHESSGHFSTCNTRERFVVPGTNPSSPALARCQEERLLHQTVQTHASLYNKKQGRTTNIHQPTNQYLGPSVIHSQLEGFMFHPNSCMYGVDKSALKLHRLLLPQFRHYFRVCLRGCKCPTIKPLTQKPFKHHKRKQKHNTNFPHSRWTT